MRPGPAGRVSAPHFLRSEPDCSASLQPFQERLAETVSWCGRRHGDPDPGTALRTAALSPPPATPWPETVRAVAEQRRGLLGRSWRRPANPLGGGLLLVYFPTPPHSRGAARSASEGYFDDRDTPPWDTWVAYLEEPGRSYVVAWVPPAVLAQATAGVAAAIGGRKAGSSLAWLEGSGVGLRLPSNV